MREKQNPVEKEWAAVVKAEERFLRHAMPARTAGWQEKITRYVPQKLEATLHTAFYKAFELIFDKGTPVIEKTCQKEKKEQNYKINAYAAEVRDTRHALRAFGREAGASRNLNLAVSAVEGVGMGFFGLGLPDIPLFLGVLLKSIYEVALSYGYTYDTQEEQIFILKLIETALSHGEQLAQNNMELNLWMREGAYVFRFQKRADPAHIGCTGGRTAVSEIRAGTAGSRYGRWSFRYGLSEAHQRLCSS